MTKPDTSAEEQLIKDLTLAIQAASADENAILKPEPHVERLLTRITSYTKQRERALLEELDKAIGDNLPIGDEIADNRSYTGERIHNKIKDELRRAILLFKKRRS